MSIRDEKRQAALDRIADHMLAHGLDMSSLRALGAAAGTSDRMLLYYFADKDEIVVLALHAISLRLGNVLSQSVSDGTRLKATPLLRQLASLMRGPVVRPYMRFWLELAALAARDQQPFLAVAGQITDHFIQWVADRLDVAAPERMAEAAALVALLDGMVLLDCVGKQASSDAILLREDRA